VRIESIVGPLVLAAIFLGGGLVHAASPRVALSIGAGVSTAYVFVYMLPELSEASAAFVTATAGWNLPLPRLRAYGSALVAAMGLHFLGINHSLRHEYGAAYDHVGRFVLGGAVLLGWLVATLTEVATSIGLGLVSGGVVMNSSDSLPRLTAPRRAHEIR